MEYFQAGSQDTGSRNEKIIGAGAKPGQAVTCKQTLLVTIPISLFAVCVCSQTKKKLKPLQQHSRDHFFFPPRLGFAFERIFFLSNTRAQFLEKCFLCLLLFHHSHFYFCALVRSWSKNKLLLARFSFPGVNGSFKFLMMIHEARLESKSILWKFSGERFSSTIFQNFTQIHSAFKRWEHTNHISCLCRRAGTRFYLKIGRSRVVFKKFSVPRTFIDCSVKIWHRARPSVEIERSFRALVNNLACI